MNIFIPAVILALIGWFVPRLLGKLLPEGVRPLLLNALLSTLIMGCLGIGYFMVLYVIQGMPLSAILMDGVGPAIGYFGRLSMISALIWGPIMILSLAGLPRKWTKEVW